MKGYTVFNVVQIDSLPQRYYERKSEEMSPATRGERRRFYLAGAGYPATLKAMPLPAFPFPHCLSLTARSRYVCPAHSKMARGMRLTK